MTANRAKDALTWPIRHRSYLIYSIGCGVAWAVILIIVAIGHSDKLHDFVLVFFGWLIGWLSASIARVVYPPPKSRRRSA